MGILPMILPQEIRPKNFAVKKPMPILLAVDTETEAVNVLKKATPNILRRSLTGERDNSCCSGAAKRMMPKTAENDREKL